MIMERIKRTVDQRGASKSFCLLAYFFRKSKKGHQFAVVATLGQGLFLLEGQPAASVLLTIYTAAKNEFPLDSFRKERRFHED